MSQTVTITISKSEQIKRFEQSTWKQGRMLEQPNAAKQVYNLQADNEESADSDLMDASFERHLWEGIAIMSEYISTEPDYDTTTTDNFVITLTMPGNWGISTYPGLKYALCELIHNGMLADWYDDIKPDSATAYKKKAELNKAEIHSNIYKLNAP